MPRSMFLMIFLPFIINAICIDSDITQFNYSCGLQKQPGLDEAASMYPSFSNFESLKFIVSNRVTHELVTRVVAIFLREILDFDKPIKFDITNEACYEDYTRVVDSDKIHEMFHMLRVMGDRQGPTIDMEMWRTSDSRKVYFSNEANSLSSYDVFRHGLYVPDVLVQNRKINVSFTNLISNVNSKFFDGSYEGTKDDFNLDKETYLSKLKSHTENITVLSNHIIKGIYEPNRCKSASEPCAIVLTSHYIDCSYFIRIAEALELKVKIYFLGDDLKRIVKYFTEFNFQKRPKQFFFVLHWTPSEIIDGMTKFRTIDLPKCEILKNLNENISCKFDPNTVSIAYNDNLKTSDPDFESLLKRIHFKSVRRLIEMYDEKFLSKFDPNKGNTQIPDDLISASERREAVEEGYNQIACEYLKSEPEYFNITGDFSWLEYKDEIFITVAGIYPSSNTGHEEYDGIQTTISMLKKEFDDQFIKRPYKLEIGNDPTDECLPDKVLARYIKPFSNRKTVIGVAGPQCSEVIEPIGIISKNFKMLTITYSAEGISFADRTNYPYFFRTIGENSQYEDVFANVFREFGWERIAAITEDGQKYTEYISRMEASNNNFKIIVNRKFPRETNEKRQLEHFEKLLKDLKELNRARIIICDIHDHHLMKTIMCMAGKLKMTAKEGFVWFLPVYISLKLNETNTLQSNETCTASELKEYLNGHFALAQANFGNDGDIISNNMTIGEWKEEYKKARGILKISPTDYSPFVYDTIHVYAKALKQLIDADKPDNQHTSHWYLKNLGHETTLNKLAEIISNLSFTGVSGKIEFNNAGSRYMNINVLQWQTNDFVEVGSYQPIIINKESNSGKFNMSGVKWFTEDNGRVPDDGREQCILKFISDAFNIECQTINSFLIATLCIVTIFLCSGFSFLFWKRKYAKKLEESAQIMTNYGLVVNGIELSRWEIPRENVIINRRIGEGAFGTVYGGEALIKDSDGWMPVAIKTLKAGANADARLDFLAESETMKRFDHKNIVKLLAVCLQKEPLYMLSEFMLYGDLKTFLLARRHLVDDKIIDDNNDISPKRLTLMALDIGRGLSYLASLNFVHRDIACRNCLINAQRICKIGDFGMTRSTYENEYYRFTRKGMLPVRWMSPESITGGVFSHASDVWAFGVFLYEVVTLGGFPFQGLNNNQVFDFVKSGGCVKIPSKCKPQLRALMSSCFSIDPKKRPGASTIVEFISSHPRMLTHCMLEAPKPNLDEQVNLLEGDTDDLEFDQLAETRERSHTPAVNNIDFLRTSASSSALHTQNNHHQEFEYLDMKLPRRLNGIYNQPTPDLTATLPNYNPIEPLLQPRSEISKSTMSLLKMYVPMCGKNRNRSSTENCTTPI